MFVEDPEAVMCNLKVTSLTRLSGPLGSSLGHTFCSKFIHVGIIDYHLEEDV